MAAERVWAAPVPLSRDLPGGAFLGILDDNAHRREFIADAVGFLEVFSGAGSGAIRNQAIDLLGIDTAGLLLSTIPGRSALRQETEKPQRGGKLLTIPFISGSSTIPHAMQRRDHLRRVQIIQQCLNDRAGGLSAFEVGRYPIPVV